MEGRQAGDGRARASSMALAHHPAGIVQAVRADIGLQQRELHEVELCAATADAFEFANDRLKRINCGGEILPFESREAARHRGEHVPGWIPLPARQVFDLRHARLQRGVVASYSVSERDMHVGKSHAGTRECGAREVAHHAPSMAVSRMSGKFPSP